MPSENETWTDDELLKTLSLRYGRTKVPPCPICGGEMSIQDLPLTGGGPVIWACSAYQYDSETNDLVIKPGRSFVDEHYLNSKFKDHGRPDPSVIELVTRYRRLIGQDGPESSPESDAKPTKSQNIGLGEKFPSNYLKPLGISKKDNS